MAVALETFVKNLEDSGIISPSKLKVFLPPQAAPKDAQDLARQLIQQKQLTKFQAQEIYQGRAKSLMLGNYTILDKIGAGGMGQVFKAEHRRMHRIVAIKTLPTKMMKDPAAVARFEREVHAAAKLSHANIVAAHDADEANGVYFLVMEYVEGSDLSALVKKNGPFPVAKACNFILQAARGLEFAHKKGVVHRDIKPANLLLDNEGTVKILDMGLARIDAGDGAAQAELTGTGMVMGTVDYMAPEQATSTHDADARADIYSLGCSLHYLIVGKATYGGETVIEKLLAHRDKPIPLLKESQPEVSDDLQAIFEKMVAKTVEDRYQTMTEVIGDLERLIAGQTTSFSGPKIVTAADSGTLTFLKETPRPAAKKTKPAILQGKNRTILIAGVAASVMLLLAIVGGWMLFGGKRDNQPDGRVAKNDRPPPPPGKPPGKTPPKPPPGKQPFGPTPATPAPATSDDYALEFDGRQSHVILPWSYDHSHPLTIEATIWPLQPLEETPFAGRLGSILSNTERAGIGLSISDKRGVQAELAYKKGESPSYLIVEDENTTLSGQKSRIAAVFNGRQVQLIRDGLVVKSAVAEGDPLPSKMQTILGGNPMADNKTIHLFFRGRIDEVRISKIARKEQLLTITPKLKADADTIALYHFDEGTGDVLKDSSGKNQHGKIVGAKWVRADAPISTETASHALAFDGKTMVTVPNIAWGPLQEFTFEAFARPDDSLGGGFIVDRYKNAALTCYQGRWQLTVKYEGAEAPAYAGEKTPSAQVGKWYHLAGVVHNNTARLFVDGKLIEATPLINPLEPGLGDKLEFGKGFLGAIRGIRISNVARYDADFAPPQKLSADPQTLALYDFADGAGNLLTDASGYRLHGQIAGAKWISLDDLDRKAAEWVLSKGRKVAVLQDGKSLAWISSATALPPGPFQLQKVDLSRLPAQVDTLVPIRNEDLAHLSTLTNLDSLSLMLAGNIISDAGLIHLSSLKSLKDLKLDSLRDVTDAGMVHLAGLTELKNLTLSHTSVTGAGLSHLQDLKKLEWLDIYHVTDEAIPALLNYTELTTLRIQQTSLTDNGIAKLAGLKKLKVLGLDSPQITDEGLKTILQFVDLNDLYLRFTAITDRGLIQLAKLSKLTRLVVTHSKVTPAGVADLQKLLPKCKIEWDDNVKPLPPGNAATNDINRSAAEWAISKGGSVQVGQQGRSSSWIDAAVGLPAPPFQLLRIDFPTFSKQPPANTIDVRDDDLSMLRGLTSLDYLNLSRTQITDAGLAHLASLKSLTGLELHSLPGVTDAGMAHLSELNEVKKLTLNKTKVTGLGLQKLEKMKQLQWLDMDQVTDASLPTVVGFSQLKTFRATKSPVSDVGVSRLAGLKNLRTLHLLESRLTDDGVKMISELTQLTELAISSAGITDKGLDHLARMSNLTRLVVTKTKVTAAGVARLQEALPKCKIEWDAPAKPAATAGAAKIDADRQAAQWALNKGGTVGVQLVGRRQYNIGAVADLPAAPFTLIMVGFPSRKDITDADLMNFVGLPELEQIQLDGTQITAEGLARLQTLPRLNHLQFSNRRLNEADLDVIASLSGLKTTELYGVKLSVGNLERLKPLSKLQTLILGYNHFDISAFARLAEFSQLSTLGLDNTSFDSQDLQGIESMANLEALHLSKTQLSDVGLKHIAKLKSLQKLTVSSTKVTPAGVAELQKALPNCKIEWDGAPGATTPK